MFKKRNPSPGFLNPTDPYFWPLLTNATACSAVSNIMASSKPHLTFEISKAWAISGMCIGSPFLVSGIRHSLILKSISFHFMLSTFDLRAPIYKHNLALLLGLLLSFSGFEMSANHVRDVENPRKNYPRAILLATIMILFISIFGSLAIAIVVPKNDLAIHAGTIQALARFFSEFHIEWLTPIIALCMACGTIAWFCAWVSGPPRSLYTTTTQGYLPKIFHKQNKFGMPTNIMILQAIIATILTFLFVFAESIGIAFIVLMNLTAQFVLLMYILMFLAAIILKLKNKHENAAAYHVPGGKTGLVILSLVGLITSAVSYIIGFFPPSDIGIKNPVLYSTVIILGNVLAVLVSIWLSKKPKTIKV